MENTFTLKNVRIFTSKRCINCGVEFRPTSSLQKTCSKPECRKKREKDLSKMRDQKMMTKFALKDTRTVKRGLASKKYLITDHRVIGYLDSPTGKAFVGVAKSPLQEVVKGFGFKGVLLQTDNRQFVQCHICGKWVKKISGSHLKRHGITNKEYKEKFNLLKGNGLVADGTSYKLEANGYKRKSYNTSGLKRKSPTKDDYAKRKPIFSKTEHENRYSLCHEQIKFRLINYIKQYRDLPSPTRKGEGSKLYKALHKRYGSVNNGFSHYGLPVRYRQGTSVELKAPNNAQIFFNYNKPSYNKENIYQWLLTNSPLLHEQQLEKV